MRPVTLFAIISHLAILGLSHPASSPNDDNPSPLEERNTLEARGSCDNAGGQCVTYFGGSNCQTPLGSYAPTCEGNCFQYSSFSSLRTVGRTLTFTGTACEAFSDSNCQNKIADTGNNIAVKCTSFPTANSMRCYFNC